MSLALDDPRIVVPLDHEAGACDPLDVGPRGPLHEELAAGPGPVLVLHGSADVLIPASEAATRERGPFRSVTLLGVGRMPMGEAPEETARDFSRGPASRSLPSPPDGTAAG